MIVKGKKSACYAFYEGQHWIDCKDVDVESGSDDEYILQFSGNCKWSVDQYCSEYGGDCPVELPNDIEGAKQVSDDLQAWQYTVKSKSKMFNVEVMCNSCDIEGDPYVAFYEHYLNGEPIASDLPEELAFDSTKTLKNITAGTTMYDKYNDELKNRGTLTTSSGNVFSLKNHKLYFNDSIRFCIPDSPLLEIQAQEPDSPEVSEEYINVTDSANIISEAMLFSIDFRFSNDSTELEDMFTYVEDGTCEIKCVGARIVRGGIFGDFESMIAGIQKTEFTIRVRVDDKNYYIVIFIKAGSESQFKSAMRAIEDFLDTAVLCKNAKNVKIQRLPDDRLEEISSKVFEAKGLE